MLSQDSTGTSGFGYTGEQSDASTGLVFLRARYYDPGMGRFVSKDPFSGFDRAPYSQHPYQYSFSNPVNLTDPSGKHPACLAALADGPLPFGDVVCLLALGSTLLYGGYVAGQAVDVADINAPQFNGGPVQPGYPQGHPAPVPAPAPPIPLDDVGGVGEAMSPDELSELFNRPSSNSQRPTPAPKPDEYYPPIPLTPTPTTCPDDDSNRFYYAVVPYDNNADFEAGFEKLHQDLLNTEIPGSTGLAGQLNGAWNTFNNVNQRKRRFPQYAGWAYQSQRVIYYSQHGLATGTKAVGVPDIAVNWITGGIPTRIEAVEQKWGGNSMTSLLQERMNVPSEFIRYQTQYPNRWLLEVDRLTPTQEAELRSIGGEPFDTRLYP